MRIKVSAVVLLLLNFMFVSAQQVGAWRLHFRYSTANDLAYSESKIMSANDKSIMLYNPSENNIRELDKANSLSDIGIKKIDYNKAEKTFIIAYNNSNVDLLTDDFVLTNMPEIKNKITSGSKSINNIFTYKSKAFLSTDLGIIVLDLKNQEVDDTYVIGFNGNSTPVLDCTVFNDTLYAIVAGEGIKTAPLEGSNLLDFNSWSLLQAMPSGTPDFIEVFNNELYIVSNKNALRKKTTTGWDDIHVDINSKFVSLKASEKLVAIYEQDSMGISLNKRILSISPTKTDTIIDDFGLDALLGIFINENDLYLGDKAFGLTDFYEKRRIEPSGKPFSNDIFSFSSRKDKVFATPGMVNKNMEAGYNLSGFYYFEDNDWVNVNRYSYSEIDTIYNFLDVKESPFDQKVYCATTSGMAVFDYGKFEVYNHTNSPITNPFSGGNDEFIPGLDFDAQGNVWMVNSQTTNPLIVFTRSGEWHNYPLSYGGNLKYGKITVDKNSQKWVMLRGKGISVFPSIEEFVGNYDNASISLNVGTANLPNDNINCITEDKKGTIWAGSDEGIAVFDCPEKIFDATTDCMVSRRIKSTLGQYTEYLFDTDIVNAITVDGANRKWVGTSSGAYLLSESGDKVLLSFNTENSPLPSNEVLTIGIQEESGEVLIGTALGMASYYGDATEPAEDISNIKAFPNPVRPEYNGLINITGLVENTYIKITDINGVLVSEGNALGGKYVWDGKSYTGKRVKTGVYLVFSSDNKSKNKAVAKIVFIN